MSIRAVYPIGANMKKIAQASSAVLDEIPLIFTPDSLVIEGLSPDKSVMILAELPATTFEEYNVSEEVSIVADKDEFTRAFKRATKKDKVIFEYGGGRELRIRIVDVRSSIEREYTVELRETVYERIGELGVELEVTARLPSDELASIIKDATLVGDEVLFQYTSDSSSIKISSFGELTEYRTELKQFKPLTYLESLASSVSVKYGIDHLKILAKVLDLADEVTISFGPEKPLKAVLDIGGGGRVVLWIAPRA